MRVERQDFGAIKRASPTPQGGLKLDAFPTRTGVLVYRKPDGSETRELRHPNEVFKAESLQTMKFAPLTDLHPAGRVDAANYRELQFGHVTDEVAKAPDEEHVAATVLVQDADMIAMIDTGKRKELSCGYQCDLDETPGEYEGERYDAIQRGIQYNHVALLPPGAGRAGPTAALRLDGIAHDTNGSDTSKAKKEKTMKTVRIDGKDYEVGSDAHLDKLEQMSVAAVKVEKDRADGLATELAATKVKLDAAEKAAKPDAIAARVAERVSLETTAKSLCPKLNCDGKDELAVMVDVLDTAGPKVFGKAYKCDAKGGRDAVKAVFDALKKAYDAMPSIGADDPEDMPPESKKGEPEGDSDVDEETGKDSKQDSFAARRRAEGDRSDSRVERQDYAGAHAKMLDRIHGYGQPKERETR